MKLTNQVLIEAGVHSVWFKSARRLTRVADRMAAINPDHAAAESILTDLERLTHEARQCVARFTPKPTKKKTTHDVHDEPNHPST